MATEINGPHAAESVQQILVELIAFLRTHGQRNFLPGLKQMVALAERAVNEPEHSEELLGVAGELYGTMHGGAGSFSDIVIGDDDFQTRVMLNRQLLRYTERFDQLLAPYSR